MDGSVDLPRPARLCENTPALTCAGILPLPLRQGCAEHPPSRRIRRGVVVPYLPFLIIDPAAVKNGVFDTYQRVMKTYVWQSTRWAVETYGVTGRLLEYGKQQYVELVQVLSLGLTYVFAWDRCRAARESSHGWRSRFSSSR
jgi:hypothetical protein